MVVHGVSNRDAIENLDVCQLSVCRKIKYTQKIEIIYKNLKTKYRKTETKVKKLKSTRNINQYNNIEQIRKIEADYDKFKNYEVVTRTNTKNKYKKLKQNRRKLKILKMETSTKTTNRYKNWKKNQHN